MKKLLKRITAVLLSTATAICGIQFPPHNKLTGSAGTQPPIPETGIEGAQLHYEPTLRDNGSTYTLTIEAAAITQMEYYNSNSANVTDSYHFTAPYTGTYVVDLWGGDGADTDNTRFLGIGVKEAGGKGGKGGHVYGRMELTKGQTLVIALGSIGEQTLTSVGGGANGDGGAHGENGLFEVGGGGGYSVVYLFEPGEFERKYMTGAAPTYTLSKQDRESKFVMIAGGGGGAGAHPGPGQSTNQVITSLITKKEVQRPDGGNAGTMPDPETQTGGSPSGSAANGTYYAGENGKFVGKSSAYIGIAGTFVPGPKVYVSDAHLFSVEPSEGGNDWYCTIEEYQDREPGSGGNGNLRGGGGGAGYCGASGGNMDRLTTPSHVGGGGGGSSYIDEVLVDKIEQTDVTNEYVSSKNRNDQGKGSCLITFLPDNYGDEIEAALNLVYSPYFTHTINGGTSETITLPKTRYVNGVVKDPANIEIEFTPAEGFMGGNNVPLLETGAGSIGFGSKTYPMEIADDKRYVNVPFRFEAEGKTVTVKSSAVGSTTINPSALYNDKYAEVRNGNIPDDEKWKYAFVGEISPYTVQGVERDPFQCPTETTIYEVGFTVDLPEDAKVAAVGKPNPERTYYQAEAAVVITDEETLTINGANFAAEKTLEYDGKYKFGVKLRATGTSSTPKNISNAHSNNPNGGTAVSPAIFTWTEEGIIGADGTTVKPSITGTTNSPVVHTIEVRDGLSTVTYIDYYTINYQVPVSGYYYISAYGGQGGRGSDLASVGGYGGATGGAGGTGAYTSGITWLNAETNLTIVVGNGGVNINEAKFAGWGGKSGHDAVDTKINNLVVAKGGKGGTAASFKLKPTNGSPGQAGVSSDNDFNESTSTTFGLNLTTEKKSALLQYMKTTDETAYDFTTTMYGNGGSVYIIPMIIPESPPDIEVEVPISDYFNIGNVTASNNVEPTISGKTVKAAYPYTFQIDVSAKTGGYEYSISTSDTTDKKLNIPLTPIDAFLGGNDVPLIDTEGGNNVKIASQKMNDNAATDIANVKLTLPADFEFWGTDQTITCGEPVKESDLFHLANGEPLNSLCSAFVTISSPDFSAELKPDATTTISKTYTLTPNDSERSDHATVIGRQTELKETRSATITVNYTFTDRIDNATLKSVPIVKAGEGCTVIIAPDEGYTLDDSTVKLTSTKGKTLLSGMDYTCKNGVVTVYSGVIDGNIEVTGECTKITYKVRYLYQENPGNPQSADDDCNYKTVLTETRTAGETFTPAYKDDPRYHQENDLIYELETGGFTTENPTSDIKATYKFHWELGDLSRDGENVIMPAANIDIIGYWSEQTSYITFTCVDESGNTLLSEGEKCVVTVEGLVGSTCQFIPFDIPGYAIDETQTNEINSVISNHLVELTYTESDQNIFLVYKALPEGTKRCVIIYQDTEGSLMTMPEGYENPTVITLSSGYTYSVTPPQVEDYTCTTPQFTLDYATAESGYYPVIYKRKSVTLHFMNGKKPVFTDRSAFPEREFTFNADTGLYEALPVLVEAGCDFKGWTLEGSDVIITDESTVPNDADDDLYLYAKLEKHTSQLIVLYKYSENAGERSNKPVEGEKITDGKYTASIAMDDEITGVPNPTVNGFTSNGAAAKLNGTKMPAGNKKVLVLYEPDEVDLTISYVDSNNNEFYNKTVKVPYLGEYSYESPYDGTHGVPDKAVVSGVMNTTEHQTIKVTYYEDIGYSITVPSTLNMNERGKVIIMGTPPAGSIISVGLGGDSAVPAGPDRETMQIPMRLFDEDYTMPATVTMEKLTLADKGTEEAGIYVSWQDKPPIIGTWEGCITYKVTQTETSQQ